MSLEVSTNTSVHATEDLLEEYCFGRLAEPLVGILEEHLLLCESCRAELAGLDEYIGLMKTAVARSCAPSLAGTAEFKNAAEFRSEDQFKQNDADVQKFNPEAGAEWDAAGDQLDALRKIHVKSPGPVKEPREPKPGKSRLPLPIFLSRLAGMIIMTLLLAFGVAEVRLEISARRPAVDPYAKPGPARNPAAPREHGKVSLLPMGNPPAKSSGARML